MSAGGVGSADHYDVLVIGSGLGYPLDIFEEVLHIAWLRRGASRPMPPMGITSGSNILPRILTA